MKRVEESEIDKPRNSSLVVVIESIERRQELFIGGEIQGVRCRKVFLSKNKFSRMALDQLHEQNNKYIYVK